MTANPRGKVSKPAGRQSETTADPEAVERYLKALVHPLKFGVELLRKIILKADARVAEGIKWNAPSFYCGVVGPRFVYYLQEVVP
jgi:hypothetical protein